MYDALSDSKKYKDDWCHAERLQNIKLCRDRLYIFVLRFHNLSVGIV